MHNRLYQYLQSNKLLYKKRFGFQEATSTDHVILKLTDQLYDTLNNDIFTIGVFIDLFKAFDTVDNKIIQKLQHYGIQGNNLRWYQSYLTNRK